MLCKNGMRSAFISVSTASLQLVVFALFAAVVVGPALILVRAGIGGVSVLAKFFLNRQWAFGATHGRRRDQAWRFGVAGATAVALGTAIFAAGSATTSWNPNLLQAVSMVVVWPAFTFPVMKHWVFAQRDTDRSDDSAGRYAYASDGLEV